MSIPTSVRRFYRVVTQNPPTRYDFLSNAARGRRLRPSTLPALARLWDGISVSSTPEGARYTARQFPRSGAFVAIVDVPDDERFRVEQTTDTPEHYTLWGDAETLLHCVIATTPA